ncbi:alpha-ketoglutarate-dependent dioxygenase alkB homolog 6 isoform X1 [Bombus pyrosoma]|uniref:alpha-ketoglutarate-dependent dioxygenase alkB homolog 6 isoform X1 n=1 Tax=Bombus pyrosoma TaxID=396416 RepID=UPI001CB8AEF1|nr:alpha-ketoglutarate-dependent dioxygenase alkB homolog 6 isoform X1 [Bombus pyrosoma]XP_043588144.1 alpha-ketoglutarate-dependent dioxygenase alkB homolog 6 isoform X1 [Bombus pyrosoma]XP_043588145.1 alpha-ketoglutarate-dependent dioxygenase alkB homolog 6 isoform X1 [Bombus pyrosoma]
MEEHKHIFRENVIPEVPDLAIYIPNFITQEEEDEITKYVNSAPLPKWTQLTHRRLQNWGGIPHPRGMIAEEIPSWLQKYLNKVSSCDIFEKNKLPNHVLLNEYLSGQGIMAHSDGPLFHPIVTTISCGSHTLLDFYKRLDSTEQHQPNLEFSFLLERRSLFILQGDLYHNYLHSIAERDTDVVSKSVIKNLSICGDKFSEGEILQRGTRLSLTIRHVPKTSKLKLRIG